jgi:hypothetical protein
LTEAVRRRLPKRNTCIEAVDDYEAVFRTIWDFMSTYLGETGAQAIVTRSIQVTGRNTPMVLNLRATTSGVDFGPFHTHAEKPDCSPLEITDALVLLSAAVFDTIFQLTGEALSGALMRELEIGR